MAHIEWNDELYSVGILKIDQQHKKLVDLINTLETNIKNTDKVFINKILTALVEYTKYHFHDEEKIMKNMGFKDFDPHVEQHQRFINRINKFIESYEKSEDQNQLDQVLHFLKEWLMHHIIIEDKKYMDHLLK